MKLQNYLIYILGALLLFGSCKTKDTPQSRDYFEKIQAMKAKEDKAPQPVAKAETMPAKAEMETKAEMKEKADAEMATEKVKEESKAKESLEAQKTDLSASDKMDDTPLPKSLLWEISGKDLKEPSYLYGTIHIIGAEDFFIPAGTKEAMDACKKVVFEVDMNEMSDISSQMGLLQGAFMKDNKTLKDVMSAEDYEMVKAHFKKMGLPLFMFEKMKPMLLTVFASGDINPNDMKSGKIKSYEMEFLEMANANKQEIGGLETLEFQMSIFDKIPYEDQATMLVETIKSGDTNNDQFKEMVDMYKNQDIQAMVEMFDEEEGGLEGYDDVLVVNRNKNWIPVMSEMMTANRTFFAVGAGHLAGAEGVIRLLQKEGYAVKPYKMSK